MRLKTMYVVGGVCLCHVTRKRTRPISCQAVVARDALPIGAAAWCLINAAEDFLTATSAVGPAIGALKTDWWHRCEKRL